MNTRSAPGWRAALPLLAWRTVTTAASPLLPLWLARRARRGKEDAARLHERRGEGAERPSSPLLWLHGASVGESQSALPLIEALAAARPNLHFLLTTGTVTAARLLAQRLPPSLAARVQHRFVPLDVPAHAARFLDGWRPDAAVFIESEIWPNLILAATARNVPMALVNARVSARSAQGWGRMPAVAQQLFGAFRLVIAQTELDAARLRALGAASAEAWGNLKFAARPLPAAEPALAALRAAIGARPVLLAASTHPGEEAQIAMAHDLLGSRLPYLLTIIAPRHPERGPAIAAELAAFPLALRSTGALPEPETSIYIADTLGELGLLYRLAGAALVGGSLVPHGGQNPLEAARLGCPILLGPHTANFTVIADRLLGAGAAIRVEDSAALAEAAALVLTDFLRARSMTSAAARIAADAGALPERMAAAIETLLPAPSSPEAGAAAGPG
ncbi:3-deoxy-D-manno-octulosonic acid transferase [Roseomonas xinghualingensis]|uniref:3-deoxy-D-manno-octulosonic acid transferase n=1 Tax=Roseomonas xinghualingensis TaxID=2986475 RepID=UPI0021F1C19C|nr:3-deoxy-D-manno-octulosonic acid transferase [Roseomonas sp. SXEYE001]MCV4206454.1 3-deoxy-D-manno-octulosonic acid transferase [Roseomonas sp. SXEYE001]